MPVIMHLPGDLWPSRGSVLLVWYVGSMCLVHVMVTGTSVQSWQHLLKHPHYADDGHQHARHVGTPRSRNSRVEDVQGVSTESPVTPFPRSTGTSREQQSTTSADSQRPSSVNPRTYTVTRASSAEPVSGHKTAANGRDSTYARELATPSGVTATPFAGQSRVSTPSVHSRTLEVTFPPQDYYSVNNGSPDGFHKTRKNSEPSASPTKPKIFSSITKEIENVREANEHFILMRGAGRCQVPRAQVVRVKDFYSDPGKEYLPRCTLLHLCNDQAGCCDAEGFQCMPKAMQEVALSFYVIRVGKESHLPDLGESVTQLLFVNHTECECLPVDNLPRVVEKPSKTQQNDHHHHVDPNTIQNHPSKCQECPLPFCKREYPDGRCSCDCFDRQRPCLRIKRGREPMQESERRCVEKGKCHVPVCEYGSFDAMLGRCPRRPEDHQRRNQHHQKNHRWTFFERD